MQPQHLPTINARYWAAIVAASMCGANCGDFASRVLQLGHTRGLLPFALIFAAILWAERRSRRPAELYYWLAIIVLRTAATNLADLATHDLQLGYIAVQLSLAALMSLVLLTDHRRFGANRDGTWGNLPEADARYWLVMLAAGTLGTATGDWVADVLGLGVFYGSLVLLIVFTGVLVVATRYGQMTKPWYWLTIVAARTAGTTLGDFGASRKGLGLGLPVSTLCTSLLLLTILVFWRSHGNAISPFAWLTQSSGAISRRRG